MIDLQARQKALNEQLQAQIAAVNNARGELQRLEIGVHQLQGALAIVQEMLGDEKGNGVTDERANV